MFVITLCLAKFSIKRFCNSASMSRKKFQSGSFDAMSHVLYLNRKHCHCLPNKTNSLSVLYRFVNTWYLAKFSIKRFFNSAFKPNNIVSYKYIWFIVKHHNFLSTSQCSMPHSAMVLQRDIGAVLRWYQFPSRASQVPKKPASRFTVLRTFKPLIMLSCLQSFSSLRLFWGWGMPETWLRYDWGMAERWLAARWLTVSVICEVRVSL